MHRQVVSALPRTLAALYALTLLAGTGAALAGQDPDFSLPGLDGRVHKLSDYHGKWVLVNYWATWCPPCRKELPELEDFHVQADGHAVVLGVNMEDIDEGELQTFVEQRALSYPILMGTAAPSQVVGEVTALPTSYLVAPDGKVVARQEGPVTAQAVDDFIQTYEAHQ